MGLLNDGVAAIWRVFNGRNAADAPSPPGPLDDFWYTNYPMGDPASGIVVTPDIAIKASAVWACVKILAETIATLPVAMYRELPDGSREAAPDHPLDELIRYQPNDVQTAIEFWQFMVVHCVLRGTGYAEIIPGARGAVDQLMPLHTDRVKPEVLPDGSLRFAVTDWRTGQQRFLLQEEMFRLPGLSLNGVTGVPIVEVAADAIGLGLAADNYAGRIFTNRLNAGGYLVHPGQLSPEAQKNLVQALVERHAGVNNSHRPIVLQEGMEFKEASWKPDDAQMQEARKWQLLEVCRFLNIPPHMVGIMDGATHSNVEQQALDLVKYTLRPWVRRIEQAMRRDLIVAKRLYSAKFNMDALLRGDSKARGEYYSKALGAGGGPAWMTVNEVRKSEGLNPSTEEHADKLPVGNNPSNALPKPNEQAALEDRTLTGRAAKVARKEITATRKALMRFAGNPAAFNDWVVAFYGGHVSYVMDNLGIPKDAARAYCEFQRGALLMSDDPDETVDKWETTLAPDIARTLAEHGVT